MANPKDTIIASASRDNLLGAFYPVKTEIITIAKSQTLVRGAVIGLNKIKAGTAAAKSGGNTGTGTCTGFALAAGGPAKIGTYRLRCLIAATDAGVFTLVDPDGILVGVLNAAITTGTTFTGGGITFVLTTVHSADFIVGDGFDLPIEADTGYGKLLNKAATDGSNEFHGILLTPSVTTASDETMPATIMVSGSVQSQVLSFYSGTVLADVKDDMRLKNIYVDTTVAADNVVG